MAMQTGPLPLSTLSISPHVSNLVHSRGTSASRGTRTGCTSSQRILVSSSRCAAGAIVATAGSLRACVASRRTGCRRGVTRRAAERPNPVVTFETTMGSFKVEVFVDRVPITASNFIDLCKYGFYKGLHVHRVVPEFVVQLGCPFSKNPFDERAGAGAPPGGSAYDLLDGSGKRLMRNFGGYIPDEFIDKTGNRPGTLSMANTGKPNTGGSQFFINVANNRALNWFTGSKKIRHPVFGRVIEGYELVESISQVSAFNERPIEAIQVLSTLIEGV